MFTGPDANRPDVEWRRQLIRSGHGALVSPSLAQQRSSLSQPYWGRADNWPDASPMFIDLAIAPVAGAHWALDNLICHGKLTVAAPPAGTLSSPVSGLFMIPRGVQPVENLTQAQTGDGFDIRSRGISLPIVSSIVPLANGGWAFAMFYNGMISRTIPEDWTIRAVINCNPGTAAPGPGAGSFCELIGVFTREHNYGASL